MNDKNKVFIFGEVLFDCFPAGEKVLGGAPFNVAWHLQALGDRPQFISRVGDDESGKEILVAMQQWGMNAETVQVDPFHRTGQVEIELIDDEPHYDITPDCAYDFIDVALLESLTPSGILYHGSLGLRNPVARQAFSALIRNSDLSIFLDVNLRPPWWRVDEVLNWLEQARWVKLNEDELRQLGFASDDLAREMRTMQERFQLEQLIVTRGAQGATVLNGRGEFHEVVPVQAGSIVDTVGAGDAFTAMYIHGLISSWDIGETLELAQRFASAVIGLRGAVSDNPAFYQDFIAKIG